MSKLEDIRKQVESVPTEPGCYLWKDSDKNILYVGKAKSLRSRMKQYVLGSDERAKIPRMMEMVDSFDYVVCQTETEALVLEKSLIKQYSPPFNADFKDGKSYPFIALTMGDEFPAIKYTREQHRKDTKYFGPYTDSRAAREMMDTLRRVVPLCSANCAEHKRLCRNGFERTQSKPCFDYHVGLGPGACCGALSKEEYADHVKQAERFLSGKRSCYVADLSDEMREAALELDFERAGRIKKRIDSIAALSEKQKAVCQADLDADVIGLYREETLTGVQVMVLREGRIIISNDFILDKGMDIPQDVLLENFILRYYDSDASIPRLIILEGVPHEDADLQEYLSGLLASKHGAKLRFDYPKKGEKHDLLLMAQRNARHSLMRYKVRSRYDEARVNDALLQLESALALPAPPLRMECFDISTIHGRFSVASMVVFSAGMKDSGQYRRFKIRSEFEEANDFAMMSEVFSRRYGAERMEDSDFGKRPDLIIVDGGKPQLRAALEQLSQLGLDIPVCGLAKQDEEIYVSWSDTPVILPTGSASLYLIKQIRDEAHRFAISFHRELRDKSMKVSILDEVPGLGPKRRKLLMNEFGSFKKLCEASEEEIAAIPGIPQNLARDIREILDYSMLIKQGKQA